MCSHSGSKTFVLFLNLKLKIFRDFSWCIPLEFPKHINLTPIAVFFSISFFFFFFRILLIYATPNDRLYKEDILRHRTSDSVSFKFASTRLWYLARSIRPLNPIVVIFTCIYLIVIFEPLLQYFCRPFSEGKRIIYIFVSFPVIFSFSSVHVMFDVCERK